MMAIIEELIHGSPNSANLDINKVSRAMHALNMVMHGHFHMLGVSDGILSTAGKKWENRGFFFRRKALKIKTIAIIEHDRVLTER